MILRISMIRLTLIVAALLALCACDPRTDTKDLDRVVAYLESRDLPPESAYKLTAAVSSASSQFVAQQSSSMPVVVVSSSSSSVEPVQVAVVPPPPEVCHVSAFRGFFVDCHGFNVEGPER